MLSNSEGTTMTERLNSLQKFPLFIGEVFLASDTYKNNYSGKSVEVLSIGFCPLQREKC